MRPTRCAPAYAKTVTRASSPRRAHPRSIFSTRSHLPPDIDWSRVEMFHLDEYVGLSIDHPASFRRYLLDRLINKVGIGRYHLLDGENDPAQVARQVGDALAEAPDRSRVRRHRRERTSRLQRSSSRLHDRRSVSRRDAGRRVPPATGRRRVVRVDCRRPGSGDLDVGAADSEIDGDHRGRARCAKGCCGESVRRRTGLTAGARVDPADTPEHDAVSRWIRSNPPAPTWLRRFCTSSTSL